MLRSSKNTPNDMLFNPALTLKLPDGLSQQRCKSVAKSRGRNSSLDVAGRFLIYILPTGPSVGFSGITVAITQVAANTLEIKIDAKCDLGSSHCYPAFVVTVYGLSILARFHLVPHPPSS